MATFSFAAGNVAKLVRAPLYVLGRIVTLFVPRTERWVFGCGAGVGDGPLALWRVATEAGAVAVWLSNSAEEAAEAARLGIPTIPRLSLRGFWATVRAGVLVVAYGTGDVNPYGGGGALLVQLWHGIPLKRIGLDSAETLRAAPLPDTAVVRGVLAALYRAAQRRIRVLPAASHLVRGRLESAFALPDERIVVTGEPRVDVLSTGTPAERAATARSRIAEAAGPLPDHARLLLYAPTWRDGSADPGVPSAVQWRMILATLEEADAVLLVRSHRLGAGDYTPPWPTGRVRALGADRLRDVTPVLPALTALITDYSSLAFDAGLVGLPVLYLAPDVAEYTATRGLYGRYEDVAGADWAASWDELGEQLSGVLDSPAVWAERAARSARLSERVHAFRDGRNARRVHEAIMDARGHRSRRSR